MTSVCCLGITIPTSVILLHPYALHKVLSKRAQEHKTYTQVHTHPKEKRLLKGKFVPVHNM